MPTNRPFMYNFLAAFRAQSALPKASPTGPSTAVNSAQSSHSYTTSASTANTQSSTATTSTSNPHNITTKSGQHNAGATTAAVQMTGQFQSARQHSTSPYSKSPASPGTNGFTLGSPSSRQRRGSDSSNEGFREVIGAEKWYIGGRTATGEERYYKLGMVKRPRSIDRISIDQVSL
ncbi:hypothetical protein M501DRAFT_938756 [Patellaria atrata CBS 101060]|uniref:Uncharacterized protein n=1 Tax=Patellaria atrata CBS 101060 TaxID=1346257 RepID=A0A9P4S6S5_9PEZI|nr:hypothetical protein M501DRAFT_938756 [Patellaria atrata CBS 101060]